MYSATLISWTSLAFLLGGVSVLSIYGSMCTLVKIKINRYGGLI